MSNPDQRKNTRVKADWPFWAALPLAGIITACMGILVAASAIRLKGFYVAVATLAFFFLAQYILQNLDITGKFLGLYGIASPGIGRLDIKSEVKWYYLLLVLTTIGVIISAIFAKGAYRGLIERIMVTPYQLYYFILGLMVFLYN